MGPKAKMLNSSLVLQAFWETQGTSRPPKTHPRRIQNSPRRTQDGPRPSKTPPRRTQTSPSRPQVAPKTPPRRPEDVPRCSQDAPRRLQNAPRCLQDTPRQPRTFPRRLLARFCLILASISLAFCIHFCLSSWLPDNTLATRVQWLGRR